MIQWFHDCESLHQLLSERKLSVGSRGAESAAEADEARRADPQAGAGTAQAAGERSADVNTTTRANEFGLSKS